MKTFAWVLGRSATHPAGRSSQRGFKACRGKKQRRRRKWTATVHLLPTRSCGRFEKQQQQQQQQGGCMTAGGLGGDILHGGRRLRRPDSSACFWDSDTWSFPRSLSARRCVVTLLIQHLMSEQRLIRSRHCPPRLTRLSWTLDRSFFLPPARQSPLHDLSLAPRCFPPPSALKSGRENSRTLRLLIFVDVLRGSLLPA